MTDPIVAVLPFALGAMISPFVLTVQALILTGVMIPLLFLTDSITYRLANRRGLPVQERPRDGYLGFRK